jgi:hypothetical protein
MVAISRGHQESFKHQEQLAGLGVDFAWARKRGALAERTCKAAVAKFTKQGLTWQCRGWTEIRADARKAPPPRDQVQLGNADKA